MPAHETAATAAATESAKDRLLAKAVELFNRKGYAATTVREIVEAAGVTKPVLYYYFGNKEGIFQELMRSGFARLEQIVENAQVARGGAFDRITQLCDTTFALYLESIPVVRLMNSIFYGPPQGAPYFDFHASHERFLDAIGRLVEEGMKAGELRKGSVRDVTWAIIGALNVVMEVELAHPELSIGREGLGRLLRLIFAGLAARPEKTRRNRHE